MDVLHNITGSSNIYLKFSSCFVYFTLSSKLKRWDIPTRTRTNSMPSASPIKVSIDMMLESISTIREEVWCLKIISVLSDPDPKAKGIAYKKNKKQFDFKTRKLTSNVPCDLKQQVLSNSESIPSNSLHPLFSLPRAVLSTCLCLNTSHETDKRTW